MQKKSAAALSALIGSNSIAHAMPHAHSEMSDTGNVMAMMMNGMRNVTIPPELPPDARALKRIKNDTARVLDEQLEGIHVCPDDNEVTLCHALIQGPKDTPYEGGFFYFLLRFPPDYPIKNPTVKLMTTGNGKVRFNPNLYNSGKVCLSILGTWTGPAWTACYDLKAVLLSIQSLLCEEPYYNEPGYEASKGHGSNTASLSYNANIVYQTLRVAALDMYENNSDDTSGMPQKLRDIVAKEFERNLEFYKSVVEKHRDNANNVGRDLCGRPVNFDYVKLQSRLMAIETNRMELEPSSSIKRKCESSTVSSIDHQNDHVSSSKRYKPTASSSKASGDSEDPICLD